MAFTLPPLPYAYKRSLNEIFSFKSGHCAANCSRAEAICSLPNAKLRSSRKVPLSRDYDYLVGTVLFLASDDAAFITGQTINVDGGNNFV